MTWTIFVLLAWLLVLLLGEKTSFRSFHELLLIVSMAGVGVQVIARRAKANPHHRQLKFARDRIVHIRNRRRMSFG